MNRIIVYKRVSTEMQSAERQCVSINADIVFEDIMSGREMANREQFQAMLEYAQEGDSVYFQAIDRCARSLKDLINILDIFKKKGVEVHFITEGLVLCGSGENAAISDLLLGILGAIAQFETRLIKERQRWGLDKAMTEGRCRGRKSEIPLSVQRDIMHMDSIGTSKQAIADATGVGRTNIYNIIRRNTGNQ